jgi:polysaccharide biosynthesis protein PslJ
MWRAFVEGFLGQDLATQMRFGEYKDALILIQRYPLFGVGFAGTPDIDIYLGVANVYFTIAQVMGLVGLLAFFAVIGTVFVYAYFNRAVFKAHPRLDSVWLGLHAALVGALVAGIFDHYLFQYGISSCGDGVLVDGGAGDGFDTKVGGVDGKLRRKNGLL